MRVHRFIGPFDFRFRKLVIADKAMVHQITRVLRLKVGDEIGLCDGKGNETRGRITAIKKHSVSVALGKVTRNMNEPSRRVTLYCAVLKRENFEWVVQKAVEVGIHAIVPVITQRTVKLGIKQDRLAKIAREAAEQSGRGKVPAVSQPVLFNEAIKVAATNGPVFFFDMSGTAFIGSKEDHVSIFIGPEGGWDERERAAARVAGFQVATLGPRTLRAETAAVVASYLSCHLIMYD